MEQKMGKKDAILQPPGAIMPDEAFTEPTPEQYDMNQEYWLGYDDGKSMKTVINSPAGFPDYGAYKTAMEAGYYKPASEKGYPTNYNVGWNNCCNDIINWLWTNDPKSPHNVVS
jgi:hypothetical protein